MRVMVFNNDGPEENNTIGSDPFHRPEANGERNEQDSGFDLTDPFDGPELGREWTPLGDVEGWNQNDVEELENQVETDDRFDCDHAHDKRQFVVVPQSGGVNMLGAGLQAGGGVVKLGCSVCGEMHDVEGDTDGSLFG